MYCNITNCVKTIVCDIAMLYVKTMACGVAVNSLTTILIMQPARSDVKIGPNRAHENRLNLTRKRTPGKSKQKLDNNFRYLFT